MNTDLYIRYLNYLFNLSNIPLCMFRGDEVLLQVPESANLLSRIQPYLKSLKERNQSVSYISTSYDSLYGLIHIAKQDLYVFAGPYFTAPLTKETIPTILKSMNIPEEESAETRIFLNGLPCGPLHRFLSYLSCLHFALNQELRTIEELDYDPEFQSQESRIQTNSTRTNYEPSDNEFVHSTYLHEMQRMDLIARGDTEGMKRALATPLPGRYGIIGSNALRQSKNIFIAACTLYTRAAIAGGLDIEDAYNLSDTYIRSSEFCSSLSDVERLMRQMPLDFTERVEKTVTFKNASQPIMSAIHYIKERIDQPLQADEIATHVNLSTSYFLKRFKAETGMGLTEFITKAKIDEACNLLSYTDKSLTEISNHLYFSSQSYFQNVFKKVVGFTPGQYRNMKKQPVFMKRPE